MLAVLVVFALMLALIWFHFDPGSRHRDLLHGVAQLAAEMVPSEGTSLDVAAAELRRLADWFRVEVALFSAAGDRIAESGGDLPAPTGLRRTGFLRNPGKGPTVAILLADGRWLVFAHRQPPRGAILGFALLALATAIGAFPLARRLTRRLERLETGVTELGRGELDRRVEVEGRDEIASLARAFNRTADRIERLVEAQRQTLAAASHELRTPLARMRVAVELLDSDGVARVQRRLTTDIEALDELIEELLMASRIEIAPDARSFEEIDFLALVAEESARVDAELNGRPISVNGDLPMLRRMIRNLLRNAEGHGDGRIEVELDAFDRWAVLRISDQGPGIPKVERERIFEPFYRLGKDEEDGNLRGLGLALVRRIADHHRGSVECRSRPHQSGATFEVRLPLANTEAVPELRTELSSR